MSSTDDAVEALLRRGIPQGLAERWIATGVVDPKLREFIDYGSNGRKFQHWIQAKHVHNGLIRHPGDLNYLTLEEVEIWYRTGWDPEPAAAEFRQGHRRPWESLYDPTEDGTGQHLRKQHPAEDGLREHVRHIRPVTDPYERFGAWRRLTDIGLRTPEQMSPEDRYEYDHLGFKDEEIEQIKSPAPGIRLRR